MTNDEFISLGHSLTTHSYTFAKTMPKNPHWYTLRWDWDDNEFVDAVKLLRANGYERRFYKRSYTSFDLNDSYYWTMDEPIDIDGKPNTYVLNKAMRTVGASDYDVVAGSYDNMFTDDAYLEENRHIFNLIGWKTGQSVLDIGCGTGLFLEYNRCDKGYVGIDPSKKMLDMLVDKFGRVGKSLLCTDFERFYLPIKFDKVIATFGSASYIRPETIGRVRHFIAEGGDAFLMFYRDGYKPETYSKANVEFSHHTLGEYLPHLYGADVGDYHEFSIVRLKG